jgi:hypothetical protein
LKISVFINFTTLTEFKVPSRKFKVEGGGRVLNFELATRNL